MAENRIPVAAVVGPTATGKTELGIGLCQRLGGEVVSCDSMQVYRGLPIGTAQPTSEELAAVPHHLVGCLEVDQPFSVSDYVEAAGKAIQGIRARGKFPVLVGGTGLYARSLLRGFSFEENGRDEALRQKLFRQAEEQGADALYRRLQELDPKAAEEIHPHNVKRVVRALEYIQLCGEPFSQQAERSRTAQSPYQYVMLCLTYRDREALYRRIDQRVDRMLEQGLLEEARLFFNRCQGSERIPTAAQAIGYKELFPYFRGEASLAEAVESIKRESRRYAKRQITWFKREERVEFLYVDSFSNHQALLDESLAQLAKWGVVKGGTAFEQ
ncbi:tRNA (adenosine(37)-N6)-dimethylallyltransferase MiaA [Acutalibacter sp. LFL-21]|uniref:tRNA (adenosine(37)-N6)-dimethylallyltransferase MiaA n=1 Tax=Acutalibacter sp. LFL-21 TaxID=2983399 RepID=UPI0021D66F64|nr:tRNA (adenosine(37)-N6)-dimethylallyltransferase MiaA [Acutalibacter sp. LFL-21]MCU7652363.1 tRNA (adenosine(37)-N6)-dimethylallyltransferase MiaA [Acutalibacter sp. LFL-21]